MRILLYVLISLLAVATIGSLILNHELQHIVSAIPHWKTSCPKDAVPILVIGQSQASNTGPKRHISFSDSRAFAGGNCYYLRDPMPGTGGQGGTIWPMFADAIGKKVVIADIAISGSSIEQWTIPEQKENLKHTLASLRAAGYPKPLIIWMQGETNGARRTDANTYYTQLHTLIQFAPDHHWLITRESICYDVQTKWAPLDVARDQIARDFSMVKIGPDLDTIGITLRQPDRCHLSAEGQVKLAAALGLAARDLLEQ